MRLILYCFIVFGVIETCVNAFVPVASRSRIAGIHRRFTGDSIRSTASSDSSDIEQRKQAAVEALEKLLVRQQAEVKDTQLLLKQLQKMNIEDEKTSNRAASVLSGVDYGFVSRSEGASFKGLHGGLVNATGSVYEHYGPPSNIIELGVQQFRRNLDAIKGEYKDEDDVVLTPKQKALHTQLKQLTLNSTAIWEREFADGPIEAPLVIKIPYLVLCGILDVVFEGRYVPSRFFLLETVARMPYFSYITMLHL
jgi:hypothetical protein